MEQRKEQPDLTRWIPVVVPLFALALVLEAYLIAAVVLVRVS
jgi:hypothetical protein